MENIICVNAELEVNNLMKKLKEEIKKSQRVSLINNDIKVEENANASKVRKLAELHCKIYPFESLSPLKYVVVCSLYNGKILLSRRKDRKTWETQGGHIESGETPKEAAQRELYEESGVTDAILFPVCDYLGYNTTEWAYGEIFYACVNSIGEMPKYEMEEIQLFDELPENLTYPSATPEFFKITKSIIKKMNETKP